jgi:hypothetical protein
MRKVLQSGRRAEWARMASVTGAIWTQLYLLNLSEYRCRAKLPETPFHIIVSRQKGLLISGSASKGRLSLGEQVHSMLS